jgi:hypothetical protein
MTKLFTILAVTAAAGSLLTSNRLAAQASPTTARATHVRITQGPELESASEYLTIIRWTTNNPGGSPVHFGVIHYGANPKELNQTAKSPIRLNPEHASTLFRVRIAGLKAGMTYYYTVGSEESNGTDDKATSTLKHFTVPGGQTTANR